MDKKYNLMPKINRNDLEKAKKYRVVFLPLFITDEMINYSKEVMPMLNSSQQTFLTFNLFDGSMRSGYHNSAENWGVKGGFLKAIYYGYGEYVFEKPFSKILKSWGAKKISEIVEMARPLYEKHKDTVKKIKTDKELSDLCSKITDFEMLDHKYMMVSSDEEDKIKEYIETHINEFAIIDEDNTQVSYVDHCIEEIEGRNKTIEEMMVESDIIDKYIETHKSELTIDDETNTAVISESAIFGTQHTSIYSTQTTVNGKKITVIIQKTS
jgi:hypothetical protein